MARAVVELRGLEELKGRLDGLKLPIRQMMDDIVRVGHETAKRGAKPHPADKGTLAATVKFELAAGAIPLHARVFSKSGIAFTVEEGRRPGKQPPVAAMERWLRSHGISATAWRVVQEIKRRGTRGVHFMQQAKDAMEQRIPELIRKTEAVIRGRWG